MSTGTDRTERHYLHRLGYHLQTGGVPDERIEDILAEAQAHTAQSGESLSEAFGSPRAYARRWSAQHSPRSWLRALPFGVAGLVGGGALMIGAVGLAGGGAFGLPPVLLLVLGAVLIVGTAAVLPLRTLRDPVSVAPRQPRWIVVLLAVGCCAIITAAGVLGALL